MPEANKAANSKKTKSPTPHAVSRELDARTASIEEMMENCKISLGGLIERDDKTKKENEFGRIRELNERTMKEKLNMSADELKFCNELYGKLAKFYTGKEPNGEDEGQQGNLSDPTAPPVEDDANEGADHTAVSTTVNLKKKDAKASSFASFGKDKWLRTEGIKIAKEQSVAKSGKKARRSSLKKRKFSSPPGKRSSSSKKKSAAGPGEVKSRKNSSEDHSDKNECIHEIEESMDQGAEMSKEDSHSDSSSDENGSRFKCSKLALTPKKGQKRSKSSGRDIHGMERSEGQGTETSGEDNHSDSSTDENESGSPKKTRTPKKEQKRSENFEKVRRRLSYDSLDEMECENQRSKTVEKRKRRVRFEDESPDENEDKGPQQSPIHRVGRAKIPRLTARRPSSESPRRHDRRYCPQSPPKQEQLETDGRKRGLHRNGTPDTRERGSHPLGNVPPKVAEVAKDKRNNSGGNPHQRDHGPTPERFGSAGKARVFHRDDSPDVRERGYALRSPSLGSGQKFSNGEGHSSEGTPRQLNRTYSSPLSPIRERSERVTRARALYRDVTEDDLENFESKCRRLMLIQEEIRSLKKQMLSGDGQGETYVRVIEPTPIKKRLERAKLEFKSEWDKLLFDEKHKLNQYMKYDYSISEFVLEYPMTWQVRRFERPQNPRTRKADDEEMEVDLGSPPAKIPRTRATTERSKANQKNIEALARAPEFVQLNIEALSEVPEAIQKSYEVTPVKRGNRGNGEVNRVEEPVPAQRDTSDHAPVVNAQTPRTLARIQPAIYEMNPDDEIYCYCRSGSNGRMIACDGEECKYGGWLHFRCSRLKKVPKGKWYCPSCRPHHNDTGSEHVIKIEPDDDDEYGAGPSNEPQDQGKGIQKQTVTSSKQAK